MHVLFVEYAFILHLVDITAKILYKNNYGMGCVMTIKTCLAIIIPLVVVLAIGLVAGIMVGSATRAYDNTVATPFLSQWMDYVQDEALLTSVVIPGAHDAATATMMWAAETQNRSVGEMLACGARYFDLRVENDDGKLVVFHGPIKGVEFAPVLDDISNFLTEHPSETLLLDFQHFKNDGSMEGVDALLCQKLASRLVVNDTGKSDLDFAKELTIGDTRGKAIVFWGNQHNDGSVSGFATDRNYLFVRNNDAGTREGSVLHSFYDGSLNRKPSGAYLEKAIPQYVEKYQNTDGGFFVMQMQLTDPLAFIGPKFCEGTHAQNASDFVKSLKDKDFFDVVNIIMRDYLGPQKCKEIIALNEFKGTIKVALADEFSNNCA